MQNITSLLIRNGDINGKKRTGVGTAEMAEGRQLLKFFLFSLSFLFLFVEVRGQRVSGFDISHVDVSCMHGDCWQRPRGEVAISGCNRHSF